MKLDERVELFTTDNVVDMLSSDLEKPILTQISWLGERQVQIQGYEGQIKLDTLLRKYFSADAFDIDADLQKSLDCHNLWPKVKELNAKSNETVKKCSFVFRWIVRIRDLVTMVTNGIYNNPRTMITEADGGAKISRIFEFSAGKFEEFYPNCNLNEKTDTSILHEYHVGIGHNSDGTKTYFLRRDAVEALLSPEQEETA